jgi:hypothetical protein
MESTVFLSALGGHVVRLIRIIDNSVTDVDLTSAGFEHSAPLVRNWAHLHCQRIGSLQDKSSAAAKCRNNSYGGFAFSWLAETISLHRIPDSGLCMIERLLLAGLTAPSTSLDEKKRTDPPCKNWDDRHLGFCSRKVFPWLTR